MVIQYVLYIMYWYVGCCGSASLAEKNLVINFNILLLRVWCRV